MGQRSGVHTGPAVSGWASRSWGAAIALFPVHRQIGTAAMGEKA
jgi:hypothetical protein